MDSTPFSHGAFNQAPPYHVLSANLVFFAFPKLFLILPLSSSSILFSHNSQIHILDFLILTLFYYIFFHKFAFNFHKVIHTQDEESNGSHSNVYSKYMYWVSPVCHTLLQVLGTQQCLKQTKSLTAWDFYQDREACIKNNAYNKQVNYIVCAILIGAVMENQIKGRRLLNVERRGRQSSKMSLTEKDERVSLAAQIPRPSVVQADQMTWNNEAVRCLVYTR